MPDIDTIIAKWKASFAGRTRYEGQEPREDELLVDEVERLRRTVASHELDMDKAVQRIDRLQKINDALRESAAMDAAEVERLREDGRRLDWLADRDNTVGKVTLPHAAVMWHPDDIRAAIDEAMRYEPHPTEPGLYRRKEGGE